jgi:gliding motility-associated-like protein
MNYCKLFCLLLLFCVGAGRPLKADHLVGGEFRINYAGNFTYNIQLQVYGDTRSLVPGNSDGSVDVSIFDKQTNRLMETFVLSMAGNSSVPYKNLACQLGSVSTKILIYQRTKTLSPSIYNNPGGYYIVWERCCRNNGIINILNPGETGMVFYAEFPAVIKNNAPFVNSMPSLPPMPPDYLCAQELYQYSFKATDADGDVLRYTLTDPMAGHTTSDPKTVRTPGLPGPYRVVNWENGASTGNQIPGSPGLTIDVNTGLLSVRPQFSGLYVFAVTVTEFRNGVKIGEVRRDMQVKVNNCPSNNSPAITLRVPGATRDYRPGDTLVVTDATDFCFPIKFSDPDVGQSVTVKAIAKNFNGAIKVTPSTAKIEASGQVYSGQICWPDCNINSPNQLFFADLIIQDNACGGTASDSLRLVFRVIPKKNDKPKIQIVGQSGKTVEVQVGKPLNFTVVSTDSVDQDNLTVSLSGPDFEPDTYNMLFSPVSGKGKVVSNFSWTPDCTHFKRKNAFLLKFTVFDNSCFMDHFVTDSVFVKLIDVKDTVTFTAPNIFTPNNDGLNERFFISALPSDVCGDAFQDIRIFSRWGTEVFRSTSRSFSWDGKNTSDGVYYFLVRYEKRKFKGFVEIVR